MVIGLKDNRIGLKDNWISLKDNRIGLRELKEEERANPQATGKESTSQDTMMITSFMLETLASRLPKWVSADISRNMVILRKSEILRTIRKD